MLEEPVEVLAHSAHVVEYEERVAIETNLSHLAFLLEMSDDIIFVSELLQTPEGVGVLALILRSLVYCV